VQRPVGEAIVVVLRGDLEVARWPLDRESADLALVDELARLQLAASRLGYRIRLDDVGDELRDLLQFTGLAAMVGLIEDIS
jgi:hypothetical protein